LNEEIDILNEEIDFRAAGLLSRPHAFRKASRSALIVSACVVGMPCGKPL
jgi:hypothetical protein